MTLSDRVSGSPLCSRKLLHRPLEGSEWGPSLGSQSPKVLPARLHPSPASEGRRAPKLHQPVRPKCCDQAGTTSVPQLPPSSGTQGPSLASQAERTGVRESSMERERAFSRPRHPPALLPSSDASSDAPGDLSSATEANSLHGRL